MDFSELAIRFTILLMPGLFAAVVVERLIIAPRWNQFRFLLYSMLLGAGSYILHQATWAISWGLVALLFIVFKTTPPGFWELSFWDSLFNPNTPVSLVEVGITTVFGLVLGLIVSAAVQRKWLNKLAGKIKVSDKYGDESLYDYFLNAPETQWVWVRDRGRGLSFEGIVDSFAEVGSVRELVLQDVNVHDLRTGVLYYSAPAVYLSFEASDVHIELPPPTKDGGNDGAEANH